MPRLIARLAFLPTFLLNIVCCRILRVWNWWDTVDEGMLLGALPFPMDARRLHALGVRAVINTCEEYRGPVDEYARLGIQQLRCPTVDFTEPTLDAIRLAVEFITTNVAHNRTVYVHCKAGRARGATIALCWLMHRYNMTPASAQQLLKQRRRQVLSGIANRRVVKRYWEEINTD